MRFAFAPEQLAVRDAVRELLAAECPPAVVRSAWEAAPGTLDRGVWKRLAEMGVPDLLVPAAEGGAGLEWCSLVLVLEEAGRVALPHPVLETAAVAAPVLGRRLVELVGEGRSMGSVWLPGSIGLPAAAEGAVCGCDADWVLLADGGALLLAGRDAVATAPVATVDRGRRLATVEIVDRAACEVVGDAGSVRTALERAALGAAAQLLGLAQAMLDLTVAYVSERRQFGQPVGSFQAVQHRLADALKELTFARPVVYGAAWSVSVGSDDASRSAAAAKAMASDAAELVGRAALQCHGAMGYSVEHDLHLFLKRTWALSRAWGDAGTWREVVAAGLGI